MVAAVVVAEAVAVTVIEEVAVDAAAVVTAIMVVAGVVVAEDAVVAVDIFKTCSLTPSNNFLPFSLQLKKLVAFDFSLEFPPTRISFRYLV